MALEPVARQPATSSSARFFEKVSCSRHDHELLFAAQLRKASRFSWK